MITMYEIIAQHVVEWVQKNKGYATDCIVKLKIFDDPRDKEEYHITNELLIFNSDTVHGDGISVGWVNDWWEGQKRVDVLGIEAIEDVKVNEDNHGVFVLD